MSAVSNPDLGWGAGKREREKGVPPQRPSRVRADILDWFYVAIFYFKKFR